MVRPPGHDLRLHQFESTSAVKFACNPRRAGCAPTRRRVIPATHRHGVRAGVGTCPRPRNSLTVTDFGGVDIGIYQSMRRSIGCATNNRDNGVVEAFGGAPPALVFPAVAGCQGAKFHNTQQRPRTAVQLASFEGTVQVLAMVEITVHASHQAVEHVAGAVTAGVAVRDRPSVALTAQVQDVLQDDPRAVSTAPTASANAAVVRNSGGWGRDTFPGPFGST